MKNNSKWMVVTGIALVIVLVLGVMLVKTLAPRTPFYDRAEEYEKNGQWELARAAWSTAKHNAGYPDPSATGKIGRRAYYEYRIGMTYEREGRNELAIAHVQSALRTPASEINTYMGANGVEEMQKDLDDLLVRTSQRKPRL